MRRVVRNAIMAVFLLGAASVHAQDFPNRIVRIFVGGAGSGNDFAARLIAQGLTTTLNQQVIVENRPSGVIPGDTVAKSAPDGHTLLLSANRLWIGPLLEKTPYDPVRDFAPITLTSNTPNILVVHPSLPVKSVKDLIALARSKPGILNYSAGSTGSSFHLAAELFKSMADVDIVRIPFSSGSARMTSLLSGESHMEFTTAGAVAPYLRGGRLRALAVTSATPSVLMPNLPTVSGTVPGYESSSIVGILAPAKTPNVIVTRLNQEIIRVLNRPDVKQKFLDAGVETVGSSPDVFEGKIKSEFARMEKVIKAAGITL